MPTAYRWTRQTPMTVSDGNSVIETWTHTNGRGPVSCDVEVRVGKPLDVMRFRSFSPEQIDTDITYLREAAQRLYADGTPLRRVTHCPCCDTPSDTAQPLATMYGAVYVRCDACGHAYVREQPSAAALERFFTESNELAWVYTDQASLEIRMEQVIRPKVAWVLDAYRKHRGTEPRSILDVGAGGGHFVAGCRRAGFTAHGYELNRSAVQFAAEALGVELRLGNFLDAQPVGECHDLVTLWGVLEYVPEPLGFLQAARRWLTAESGVLIVEVPRADCFSTTVQIQWTDTPVRHAVPSSHMNLFSDASLATLLERAGFRPVAAWYFGMDAYEMLVQQAKALNEPTLVSRLAPAIPGLQAALDAGRLCDDVIIAAVPG